MLWQMASKQMQMRFINFTTAFMELVPHESHDSAMGNAAMTFIAQQHSNAHCV